MLVQAGDALAGAAPVYDQDTCIATRPDIAKPRSNQSIPSSYRRAVSEINGGEILLAAYRTRPYLVI